MKSRGIDFHKYILMHKNVPVTELEIDGATGSVSAIGEVFHAEHVPVGLSMKKNSIDRLSLNEWWKGRAIPASRDGVQNILTELHITSTLKLLDKCLGLSLSDQYWICPVDSSLKWSDINFFENDFTEDVGNILFGQETSERIISLMSPDNTSDGWLKKKWKIIDSKRCLIKGGSGATQQEPYNEVLASKMMERLEIHHVPYTLMMQERYPYSVCEDFITPQTELISAWYVMQVQTKANHVSVYQHYRNCCDALGVPGIKEALDRMMVLDYLMANEDRHQNNFGVVRNAETLEYLGAAPIFDSGTSLWFNKPTPMIGGGKMNCKPFKNSHDEQIKLVTSFDWLDIKLLSGIEDELHELLKGSLFIDETRSNALCQALGRRVDTLSKIVNDSRTFFAVPDCSNDVQTNTAYSGTSEGDGGDI